MSLATGSRPGTSPNMQQFPPDQMRFLQPGRDREAQKRRRGGQKKQISDFSGKLWTNHFLNVTMFTTFWHKPVQKVATKSLGVIGMCWKLACVMEMLDLLLIYMIYVRMIYAHWIIVDYCIVEYIWIASESYRFQRSLLRWCRIASGIWDVSNSEGLASATRCHNCNIF